jgi:hypothetical protein
MCISKLKNQVGRSFVLLLLIIKYFGNLSVMFGRPLLTNNISSMTVQRAKSEAFAQFGFSYLETHKTYGKTILNIKCLIFSTIFARNIFRFDKSR